jgi:hypothetical protein
MDRERCEKNTAAREKSYVSEIFRMEPEIRDALILDALILTG